MGHKHKHSKEASDSPDLEGSTHSSEGPEVSQEFQAGTEENAPIDGVPPGLEPLAAVASIHVQQQMEMFEVFFGVETENRYDVFNNLGQRIYFAGEKSGYGARQCYGPNRPFYIYLFDSQGKVVMTMERDCNPALRCWGSAIAGTVVDVRSGFTGELYGTVSQKFDCRTPNFAILDPDGVEVMSIVGPEGGTACGCMCGNAQFSVYYTGVKGQEAIAGVILKTFGLQELISDATTFGIRFNPGLAPTMKAVLLGATFAIDFAYFEKRGRGGALQGQGMGPMGPMGYGYGRRRGGGGGGGGMGCSICCAGTIISICVIFFLVPLVLILVFILIFSSKMPE